MKRTPFAINGMSFPRLPSFAKGSCPSLLDSVTAQKVKTFIENILYRTTGELVTGSPRHNFAGLTITPTGNTLDLQIQTDLLWDKSPRLGGDLDAHRFLIYCDLSELYLASTQGVLIASRDGNAGILKLATGATILTSPFIGHRCNASPDDSIYTWPNDGNADEVLSTNGSGTLAWVAAGGGGFTSFAVDGDSGPAQTITNGNTLLILGGTDLASVASATDTLTINHSASGVSAATYGDATHVARITINAQGHITAASEVSISGGGGLSSWDAAADSGDTMTIDTTNNELKIIGDVGGPIETIGEDAGGIMSCYIKHADTPVSAGTYPLGVNPQKLIQISVDQWGHITAASEYDITGGGGSMSSFNADGDSGPAQTIEDGNTLNILGGTDLASVASATDTVTINHSTSGVSAATYGDATHVAQIAINAQGHITSASEVEISGGGGGGMTSFDVTADSGTTTIEDSDTLTVSGGTNVTTAISGDTLTINASGGGGGGVILQVLGSSLGAATSTTDTSYATCISQAITPDATGNKVLIAGNINIVVPYDTNQFQEGQCDAQLFRDSTALGLVKTIYSDDFGNMGTGSYATLAWNYLDSPSSTSAVTYYLKYKSYDPSGFGAPQIELLDAQITVQEVD